MRKYFLIVPSAHPTGPVKGAIALANALAAKREVTFVTLKPGPGAEAPLDARVRRVSLEDLKGRWRKWIAAYRSLLDAAGGRSNVASISLCFSADVVNSFCRSSAVTCSSVRANNMQNYVMDYGAKGAALALCHYTFLRRFDHVVAMTRPMAEQIRFHSRVKPRIIGNFIDEEALERFRQQPHEPARIAYVGSLTRRKQPHALLGAVRKLRQSGVCLEVDMIGSGPLMQDVEDSVRRLDLETVVRLCGQLANPYPLMARAHALVLPSLSEGTPRVALEALYLGVPCVLRDADGNRELISSGTNGILFRQDSELPGAIAAAIELGARTAEPRRCLLPPTHRQHTAAGAYLELLDDAA